MNVMGPYGELAIFDVSPPGYCSFSNNVCKILRTFPKELELKKFKDGDTDIQIKESVRGKDVYVFQSYVGPLGERLYELNNFLDAVKAGGSARRVTVVMPCAFGARGERRTRARQPVPTIVIAKMLKANGADQVLTVGIHTTTIGSIYNAIGLGFENLEFEYISAEYIINRLNENVIVGAADIGGANRAKKIRNLIAEKMGIILPVAIADKYRIKANEAEIDNIIGNVEGKDVFLCDDIGDTLGTMVSAARAYKQKGAQRIFAVLNHAVLGQGYEPRLAQLLDEGLVEELVFGNTIPLKEIALNHPKVKIVPLEPFVAEAIRRINQNESISSLHKYLQIMKVYEQYTIGDDPKMLDLGKTLRMKNVLLTG